MFSRYIRICAAALFISLIAGFITIPGSWRYFKFKIGNYDIRGETASVKDSIKLFSATIAGFYASGGNPAGLNIIPVDNLIKRRIFMDITSNKENGVLLVLDRDSSDFRQIRFLDPDHAVAVVDETWVNQYQDPLTRKPVSNKKANIITVRYFLKKMWGKWIVIEYEVFGRGDRMPQWFVERFVTW